MTWLFAVLIVAALGVVVVVASGRGGSMAEQFDDRPDSRVPIGRPLTPRDLRRVRFSTAFRGYRMSEVDTLLDRMADELEAARAAGSEVTDRAVEDEAGPEATVPPVPPPVPPPGPPGSPGDDAP